jgi:hypothetical protein
MHDDRITVPVKSAESKNPAMAYSIFENKSEVPSTSEIRAALGETHALWLKLKDTVAAQHEPCEQEWVYGGKNYGWSLRLKRKKRAILYLTPAHEFFRVGFALGEKAVQAAHEARLSKRVLKVIDGAPKYVEGRAVRLEIRTAAGLADIVKLAGIKMAN